MRILQVLLSIVSIIMLSAFVSSSDIIMDVGNDTLLPWEWEQHNSFIGPEATADFSPKVNQILSADCVCQGCVKDATYCYIPLRFNSAFIGVLNVTSIDVGFQSIKILYNVSYGQAFKLSEGCRWTIPYLISPNTYTYISNIPPSYVGPNVCSYALNTPPTTKDALNDAIFRLLNQTMDTSPKDGVVDNSVNFNAVNMSFQTHGMIGVQSLWGPAILKVIVWI